MLAPSMASNPTNDIAASTPTPTFSADQISLYEQRFRDGFDLHDPQYVLWVKENHPGSSDTNSLKTHVSNSKSISTESSDVSDILKFPEAKMTSKAKKPGMNSSRAVCLSDSPVVRHLREEEDRKRHLEEGKLKKKYENEKKKTERERSRLLKEKQKEERRIY